MKLDLSKFKCIKADEKHATLQHPAGHTITVAINALEPNQQEAFKAMAKGGDVLESEEHKSGVSTQGKDVRHAKKHPSERDQAMDYAKAEAKGRMEMERHNKPNIKGLAHGGDVPSGPSHGKDHSSDFAQYEGDRDQRTFAYDHGLPCLNPNCKSHGRPHPNCRCYSGSGWNEMAEGGMIETEGMDQHFCHGKKSHHPSCQYYAGGTDDVSNIDPTTGQPDTSPRAVKSQSTAEKAQKDVQEGGNSLSDAMSNISSELGFKAEGGQVNTLNYEEIRKQKREMNNKEASKPIIRKKYAEGEGVDNSVPMSLRADQPEEPQSDVTNLDLNNFVDKKGKKHSVEVAPVPEETQDDQGITPEAQQQPQAQMQDDSTPVPSGNTPNPMGPEPDADDPNTGSDPIARQKAYEQQYMAIHGDLDQVDKQWDQDLRNGHITPKTYESLFASKNTPGKIGTLFGLLVSGLGMGGNGGKNTVLEMMQNEINNDLEAQKQSKANAQNYLRLSQDYMMHKANVKKLNTEQQIAAFGLAQMASNRAALEKLRKLSESYPPGSREYIQADQQLASLADAVDMQHFKLKDVVSAQIAHNRMLGILPQKGANQNQPNTPEAREQQYNTKQRGMLMLGDKGKTMAEYNDARHVANVGNFSQPVDQHAKDGMFAHQKLDSNLDHLKSYLTQYNKLSAKDKVNPYSKARTDLSEQITKLQSDLRNSQLETVYRTGEQPLLDKILTAPPAGLLTKITNNQVDALKGINNRDFDTLKKSKGIVEDFSKSQAQSNTIERRDPQSGKTVIYDAKTKKPLRYK